MKQRVIHEHSTGRAIWDVLVVLCIMVGAIMVPFDLAFGHRLNPTSSVLVYTIDFLLMVDIYLNFRTSYRAKGIEYNDRKSIAKHYRQTNLVWDLLGNIPFEIFFLWSSAEVLNEPVVLVIRVLSFLRLVRLNVIFNRWKRSNRFKAGYMRIAKFFVVISIFTHVIACGWYMTAYESGFPEDCWVIKQGLDPADETTSYIYALYWTVTTMTTIGYGDITPDRNPEILFVIFIMLLGASMYAYIIGNIASLVSNLDAVRSRYYNKVEMLNAHLLSRGTEPKIIKELNAYHEYVWEKHGGHSAGELMRGLPQGMRTRLMEHLAKDLLEKIPLFRLSSVALREELLSELESLTYPPNYFIQREQFQGMFVYFLSEGKIEILKESENKSYGTLETGDYFGHMSLMLNEVSTVSLKTLTYCDLFVLNKEAFENLKSRYPEFLHLLKEVSVEKSLRASEWLMEGIMI